MLTIYYLILYTLYYYNRSHKHGGLLHERLLSNYTISGLSILISLYMWCQTFHDIEILIPILIRSLFTLFLCVYLSSVSEVWYPIRTGQFQMICVDSVGLFLYFILPIILLYICFFQNTVTFYMKHCHLKVFPL